MSIFNGEKYLGSALQSIIEQTYDNFEFLIVNDGSTDHTTQILDDFASRDRRIKIFVQDNQGLTNSLNKLVWEERGEFIARMDADDIAYPERLEKQVRYMEMHPHVGMIGCWTEVVTASGLFRASSCFPDDHEKLFAYLDAGHNPFIHPSVLMRRQIFELVSPPYRFCNSQDFDLWLRLLGKINFGMVEELLLIHRKHNDQVSARYGDRGRAIIKLIVKLHQERKDGKSDQDWRDREKQLLDTFSPEPMSPEFAKAQNAYSEAVALQMSNGSQYAIRNLMALAMIYPPIKQKACLHYLLTFLPRALYRLWNTVRFSRALQQRHYRLSGSLSIAVQSQSNQSFWDYMNGYNLL